MGALPPLEILALAAAVVLLLVHVALQGALLTRELGLAYNASARDEGREATGVHAKRAARALANFNETFPAFAALAVALVVTGANGRAGATGALLYVAARAAYIPLYLLGVPYLRSLAWGLATLGIGMMLARLLTA